MKQIESIYRSGKKDTDLLGLSFGNHEIEQYRSNTCFEDNDSGMSSSFSPTENAKGHASSPSPDYFKFASYKLSDSVCSTPLQNNHRRSEDCSSSDLSSSSYEESRRKREAEREKKFNIRRSSVGQGFQKNNGRSSLWDSKMNVLEAIWETDELHEFDDKIFG